MLLIVFRLILLSTPVAALILWLRWRSKQGGDPAVLEADMLLLRRRLLILLVLTAFAAIGIYLTTEDRRAPAGQAYIPPHMENGVLVPGRFVSPEEAEAFERQKNSEDDEEGGSDPDTDGTTGEDQTP